MLALRAPERDTTSSKQTKHRQLYIDFVEGRVLPDRLMVVATQIEARVTFDFSLTQAARSPARGSHP